MGSSLAAILAMFVALHPSAHAQDVVTAVVRDGSIGPDASVQPTAIPAAQAGGLLETPPPPDGLVYVIPETLGLRTADGATLFHSFERLDVGGVDSVLFTAEPRNFSSPQLQTVITRITDGDPSRIFGRLAASIEAEFYFLNPAGILFGPGAQLSSNLTFIASTADELEFDDGRTFEAKVNGRVPLEGGILDVVALDFQKSSGSISVDGSSLSVRQGTLGLITGSPGTRIGLETFRRNPLMFSEDGTLLGRRDLEPRGIRTLTLLSRGTGTASGAGVLLLRDAFGMFASGGEFIGWVDDNALFAADSIDVVNSQIASANQDSPGGTSFGERLQLLSSTGSLRIRDSNIGNLDPGSQSLGVTSLLTISGESIELTRSFLDGVGIVAHSSGPARIIDSTLLARGGQLVLTSDTSFALERSTVTSPRLAERLDSDAIFGIELTAPLVTIGDRSSISTSNESRGVPSLVRDIAFSGFSNLIGDIVVRGERVLISNSQLSSQSLLVPTLRILRPGSDLAGMTLPDSSDRLAPLDLRAGSISIFAAALEVDGSVLSSSSLLNPNSSMIASLVAELIGRDIQITDTVAGSPGQIRLQAPGGVRISDSVLSTSVDATISKQLGSISIDAGDVAIQGSSLSSAASRGDAGGVTIRTPGALDLRGSSLTSSAAQGGAAGSISLSANGIVLHGSSILSSNTGTGAAGSVRVDSRALVAAGGSSISTEARLGPAPGQPADGNIEIAVSDALRLEDGSSISASVTLEGQGGDVRIASPRTVVLRGGSQVLAETARGNGGRIDIETDSFLADSTSRVSADAGVGTSGMVEIRSPDVDLQGGISALSTEFVNASALLRPSCDARAAEGGMDGFYLTGQVGLPASPEEFLLAFDTPQVVRPVGASGSSPSARVLLTLAQDQQADGSYAESLTTLRDALAQAERAQDRTDLAALLGASGNAQQALGRSRAAEDLLTRGSSLARRDGNDSLASRLENDLGNHYAASGESERARESYAEAVALAEKNGDALAAARALANAARAALEAGDDAEAAALLDRTDARLQAIPASGAKAALLIHLGYTHSRRPGDSSLLRAHALLKSAADLARTLDDARLRSYALGNLGQLYQRERRIDEALVLTREALRLAERSQAADVTYRWNWQEGQLLWAQGKAESAVQSYRRAVQILEETRQESRARYGSRAATFGRVLAPVYLDLADVLLRGADLVGEPQAAEALLVEARATVEKLKAAELRNYLRDDCSAQLEARSASLDSLAVDAAVVYPIALRDRLELLVRLPKGLQRFTVPVGSAQIEAEAREFRREVLDRTSNGYRASARRLYDWVVRPYAAELTSQGARTLVFVPDGALRTIPVAALHDGERFLAERFALAIAPGLSLVDPRPLDRTRVKPLIGGVSEPVDGFEALVNVPRELAAIRELFGGEVLLDGSFQAERIEGAIAESRPTLVHLASHAVFTGDPATSFLLTHDGRMTMDELASVLGRTRYRTDPVELLVLSACDTALGDDRAALGLAGVAVRSGARSALGSLWAISDDATYPLIADFYARLHEPGASRAEALRHAQRRMLESETFAHPFYWSAFVLLSNWL
jgi:filamentous hemagglutinin family protein